jgi:hypothetical protein
MVKILGTLITLTPQAGDGPRTELLEVLGAAVQQGGCPSQQEKALHATGAGKI